MHLAQQVFDVNWETGFLKLCAQPFFDLINSFIELDVNEAADIGWKFEITLVENRDALSSQAHEEHAQLKNHVLPSPRLFSFG